MFKNAKAFSSFSVDDLERTKEFYRDTLGLEVIEQKEMGLLELRLSGGVSVMIYPKGDQHVPAIYTVLNFSVDNVDNAVDELAEKGIKFERYVGFDQDEKGIAKGDGSKGPSIAWFKDPAGNILSVLEE